MGFGSFSADCVREEFYKIYTIAVSGQIYKYMEKDVYKWEMFQLFCGQCVFLLFNCSLLMEVQFSMYFIPCFHFGFFSLF